jgi:hypothetical protein
LGHPAVVIASPAIIPISAKWQPNHEDYKTLNRYIQPMPSEPILVSGVHKHEPEKLLQRRYHILFKMQRQIVNGLDEKKRLNV